MTVSASTSDSVFWLQWSLATVFGAMLLPALSAMASLPDLLPFLWLLESPLRAAMSGALLGTTLGAAQWLVLRTRFARARHWLWATFLGCGFGWAAGGPLGSAMASAVNYTAGAALCWTVVGTILGCAQWAVLRTQFKAALWWICATALTATAGVLVAYAWSSLLRDWLTAVGVWWLLYGIVTGRLLIWLSHRPRASASDVTQPHDG